MPHQGKTIKVYINDEEYNKIKESAELYGESVSGFLKKMGLGAPFIRSTDLTAVHELHKIIADLGRVGGLLKIAIMQFNDCHKSAEKIENLLLDIQTEKMKMLENFNVVMENLHGNKG